MNPPTTLHPTPSSLSEDDPPTKPSTPPGLTAMAFVVNTAPCRSAMMNARALLAGRCSHLTLVHCITGDHSLTAMQAFLASLSQDLSSNSTLQVHTDIIIKKFAHQPVAEVLAEHVEAMQPGLVLVASSVSSAPPSTRRNSYTGCPLSSSPSKAASHSLNRQTCNQPLSLKICQEVSSVPVLLVKADPRSTFLPRLLPCRPINCMLELQATSRDMMDWALAFLDPGRDKLLLAVANAFEREGLLKATAARTLTAFSVQASTSAFKVAQRALKGDALTCLPQALAADNVNLLMLHAPRSRYLSHWVVDLVQTAPSSVLIWPAGEPATSSSSLPRAAAMSSSGCSFRPATPLPLMRPRSLSCETGQSMESTMGSSTSTYTSPSDPSTPTTSSPSPSSTPAATPATERSSTPDLPRPSAQLPPRPSDCSPAPERRVHSTKLPSIPRPPSQSQLQAQLNRKAPSRTPSQKLLTPPKPSAPCALPTATQLQLEAKKPRACSAR